MQIINSLFNHFAAGCGGSFFGLKPWYAYLQLDGSCNIKSFQLLPDNNSSGDVPLILLAIFDDLLRIAALVAIGFVIYGGILYVTSQGSPDQTGKAQNTIINALIGLVVAIASAALVSFIGNRIG